MSNFQEKTYFSRFFFGSIPLIFPDVQYNKLKYNDYIQALQKRAGNFRATFRAWPICFDLTWPNHPIVPANAAVPIFSCPLDSDRRSIDT
jgi:hypothetical protein